MNEWKQLLLYLYLCILEGKTVCWYRITHISVCFGYVFLNKSNQKYLPTRVVSCVRGFGTPIFLQSLALVLASHTSLDWIFFSFSYCFLISSKEAIATAVSSWLSIFNEICLLDLFEHLYKIYWVLKEKGII